jgi:hypothetical protein
LATAAYFLLGKVGLVLKLLFARIAFALLMYTICIVTMFLYRTCTRHYVPRPCTRIVCVYRPCTRHYVPRPCTRVTMYRPCTRHYVPRPCTRMSSYLVLSRTLFVALMCTRLMSVLID